MAAAEPADEGKVVICGAGIVGASIAYHLSLRGVKTLVIERKEVAAAASGKAGGFLGRDWGSGSTQALHTISFDLHEQLAETLGLTSYRKIPTLSVQGGVKAKSGHASWLDGNARTKIMDPNSAQVTPRELTEKLIEGAVANGAELRIGTVQGISLAPTEAGGKRVTAVTVDGESIPCSKAVVAMGPWSTVASDWLGCPIPMQGIKSTSIIFKGTEAVANEPFALFCAEDKNGCHLEVYPRPGDGGVYICGIGGSDYVDEERLKPGGDCEAPGLIQADPTRVAAAVRSFSAMSSVGNSEPEVLQACMRPCPPDALPIMGQAPGVEGAYIAAGHNCWGILWGPVTGVAMSELIVDGHCSTVDLAPFSPNRFMASATKRGRKQVDVNVGEQW